MIFLRRCTTNSCASHADPVTTWHLADTATLAELSQFTSSDHHFLRRRHSFMDKTSGQQIFGTGPNVLAATKFHHGERRLLLEDSIQWSHTPVNPTKLKVFSLVGKPSTLSGYWLTQLHHGGRRLAVEGYYPGKSAGDLIQEYRTAQPQTKRDSDWCTNLLKQKVIKKAIVTERERNYSCCWEIDEVLYYQGGCFANS